MHGVVNRGVDFEDRGTGLASVSVAPSHHVCCGHISHINHGGLVGLAFKHPAGADDVICTVYSMYGMPV